MFPGSGCFCCGACNSCAACNPTGPESCPTKMCNNLVLEVEGFANTTAFPNDENCDGTGTDCEAYNGTFPLTRYDDPGADPPVECDNPPLVYANVPPDEDWGLEACCEWRSDPFEATVPSVTVLEDPLRPCTTCATAEVIYRLNYYKFNERFSPYRTIYRYSLVLCKTSDMIPYAWATPHRGDPIQITPEAPYFDIDFVYGSHPDMPECRPSQWTVDGFRMAFVHWGPYWGAQTDLTDIIPYSASAFEGNAEGLPFQLYDFGSQCGDPFYDDALWTTPVLGYSWVESYNARGDKIRYPMWNCCKDVAYEGCTTLDDWAVNGPPLYQLQIPYLQCVLTCAD